MSETIIIGGRTNKTTTLKEMLENKLVEELAIIELKKIRAEIEDMDWDIHKTEKKVPKEYVEKKRIYEILDKKIAELKGE